MIMAGSNGVIFEIVLKDNVGNPLSLVDATVSVTMKKKDIVNKRDICFTKDCAVVDASLGICQMVLYSNDIDIGGITYQYQPAISYGDGRFLYTDDIGQLPVGKPLK